MILSLWATFQGSFKRISEQFFAFLPEIKHYQISSLQSRQVNLLYPKAIEQDISTVPSAKWVSQVKWILLVPMNHTTRFAVWPGGSLLSFETISDVIFLSWPAEQAPAWQIWGSSKLCFQQTCTPSFKASLILQCSPVLVLLEVPLGKYLPCLLAEQLWTSRWWPSLSSSFPPPPPPLWHFSKLCADIDGLINRIMNRGI